MHLKPQPGRVVTDPATGLPLPEDGCLVEPSQYWFRRLQDGDVTEIKPKQQKPRTSAK
ncbi:MAG: DUF2635 domain-containing protein [Oceanospirillaceae bacterium]|jgi:hypothetical protein|nr:DUF2635 domain-containing protein [Oceanospirillaceae bacterium]|tara:strand:- start:3779 stop:3952 length:174 start_codon:yes stop_codon:yes gene_type:complete